MALSKVAMMAGEPEPVPLGGAAAVKRVRDADAEESEAKRGRFLAAQEDTDGAVPESDSDESSDDDPSDDDSSGYDDDDLGETTNGRGNYVLSSDDARGVSVEFDMTSQRTVVQRDPASIYRAQLAFQNKVKRDKKKQAREAARAEKAAAKAAEKAKKEAARAAKKAEREAARAEEERIKAEKKKIRAEKTLFKTVDKILTKVFKAAKTEIKNLEKAEKEAEKANLKRKREEDKAEKERLRAEKQAKRAKKAEEKAKEEAEKAEKKAKEEAEKAEKKAKEDRIKNFLAEIKQNQKDYRGRAKFLIRLVDQVFSKHETINHLNVKMWNMIKMIIESEEYKKPNFKSKMPIWVAMPLEIEITVGESTEVHKANMTNTEWLTIVKPYILNKIQPHMSGHRATCAWSNGNSLLRNMVAVGITFDFALYAPALE